MMKVYFYVPKPAAAETGEGVEQLWFVVFLGEEERMLRRPPVCVGKAFGKPRVAVDPRGDTRTLDVTVRRTVGGLVVIGDAKEDVCWPVRASAAKELLRVRTEQARQPELSVSGE